ncbi:MAG: DUF2550 domain-containing protein [Propionibacteriaceae bacterium]|jgi:hypothetical protein|nr:DUF2550 domain-containing protein [Propionibacteriaceae bacterium]
MNWSEFAQTVLILLVLAVFGGLVYLVWRRRRLCASRGAFECYNRRVGAREAARWQHGVVRYQGDAVVWFPLLAFAFKPRHVIPRLRVKIGQRRRPTLIERAQLFEGQCIVPIQPGDGGEACDWAMTEGAADGLLAWAEAAPPGEGQYGHTAPPGGGAKA